MKSQYAISTRDSWTFSQHSSRMFDRFLALVLLVSVISTSAKAATPSVALSVAARGTVVNRELDVLVFANPAGRSYVELAVSVDGIVRHRRGVYAYGSYQTIALSLTPGDHRIEAQLKDAAGTSLAAQSLSVYASPAPAIRLDAALGSTLLTGRAAIRFTASAYGATLKRFQLLVDEFQMGEITAPEGAVSGGFSIPLDTALLSSAVSHAVEILGTDSLGRSVRSTYRYCVVANQPVIVTGPGLTASNAGPDPVMGTLAIDAAALSPVPLTYLTVHIDDVLVHVVPLVQSWYRNRIQLDVSRFTSKSRVVTVRVADQSGLVGTATFRASFHQPPLVQIDSPSNMDIISGTIPVRYSGIATGSGLKSIQLLANGVELARRDFSTTSTTRIYSYTNTLNFDAAARLGQSVVFRLIVTDIEGAVTDRSIVNYCIQGDTLVGVNSGDWLRGVVRVSVSLAGPATDAYLVIGGQIIHKLPGEGFSFDLNTANFRQGTYCLAVRVLGSRNRMSGVMIRI